MSARAECPDCGAAISPRGLASHRRGNACDARARQNRLAAAGLYSVARNTAMAVARHAGVEVGGSSVDPESVVVLNDNWIPGSHSARGIWTSHGWVRPELALRVMLAGHELSGLGLLHHWQERLASGAAAWATAIRLASRWELAVLVAVWGTDDERDVIHALAVEIDRRLEADPIIAAQAARGACPCSGRYPHTQDSEAGGTQSVGERRAAGEACS